MKSLPLPDEELNIDLIYIVPLMVSILRFTEHVRNFMVEDGVSKSFRTGRLERELQMVQLSANRCSCITIL
jgi:hypothetical protein